MQLKYLDLQGLSSFKDKLDSQVQLDIEEMGSTLESNLQSWVNNKLGAASGIATLDANSKLTSTQIPDLTSTYVNLTGTQTISGSKNLTGTTTITKANFGNTLTITNTGLIKNSGTVNIGSSTSPFNNIYATTFHGNLSGNATSATTATTATKLSTDSVGLNTQPVYFADGVPVASTFTIETSVPANAKFTDTVYTLPNAGDNTLGGIKTGYTGTEEKRYGIKVDSNGNAYVDVAWENTTYTLNSFGITATSTELNYVDGVTSSIQTQINNINTSLGNKLDTSLKGANNGLAELDENGHILSSQLPSSVDEIIELTSLSEQTGEAGKIYVVTSGEDANKTYRWSGSQFVEISASLALGETETTAYRGDRGKAAYEHSLLTSGNPHNVTYTDVGAPAANGTGASGTWGISITGTAASAASATNADTADKLTTARTITLGGDLSGSVSFDGSTNVTLNATLESSSSGAITVEKYYYKKVTADSVTTWTLPGWSSFNGMNPEVEIYFNGFLMTPTLTVAEGGATADYTFNSSSGVVTFTTALGGNNTAQEYVAIVRTYNQPHVDVVVQKVATPVISIVE